MYLVLECVPMFINITGTLQLGAAVSYPTPEGNEAMTAGDFDSYSGNLAQRLEETVY